MLKHPINAANIFKFSEVLGGYGQHILLMFSFSLSEILANDYRKIT